MAHQSEIVCSVEKKVGDPSQIILGQLGPKKLRSWVVKRGPGYSGRIIIGYNPEMYDMDESWEGRFSLSVRLKHVRNN